MTVRSLAHLVIEAAGVGGEPEFPGLYRVGDSRHIFSDVSKLRALGWAPEVSQREMVREYLAWAAEQPGLEDSFARARDVMEAAGVLRTVSGGTR